MDIFLRAISQEHNFKISIVDISESIQEIVEKQATNPLGSMAIAKITIANTLLGLELKNKELTTSTLQTENGLITKIIAEYHDGKIRSYIANPDFDISQLKPNQDPIKQAIGTKGTLTVAQSTMGAEPYVSQVGLTDGSIDFDYMMYLKKSAQITSYFNTTVKLDDNLKIAKAVGILIQLFPEHTDEDIDYLDQKIGGSNYLSEILLKSTNYTALVEEIASDVVVLETKEIIFKCSCSEEKSLNAIKMLGKEAIEEIIAENKPLEVICDFCKTKYILSIEQIKKLI
jgi:molecular chaperone Hsp33